MARVRCGSNRTRRQARTPRPEVPTRPGLASRSFRLMLAASMAGFGGYSMLLPVVPLWASRGGAGEFGAGATTGVLMAATVGTQLGVPWLLRRLGHRTVLAGGMLLLGAPTPWYALAPDLGLLLAVSLARGVGFGLLTVAGSALVAELVDPAEHGRAAARYGLAVGLPQLVLLPAGVGIVDLVGFTPLFAIAGALPVVAALLVRAIVVPRTGAASDQAPSGEQWRAMRSFTGPFLAMLTCSIAQGGLITFLPLAVPDTPVLVPVALLATTAGALLARLVAGELVDNRGLAGKLLGVGVGCAAVGLMLQIAAVNASGAALAAGVVLGAGLVGIGFGVVQNDALVVMFAGSGAVGYGGASAAWNIAYDTGTGVGAAALGAVAQPAGFDAAFGVAAGFLVATWPVVVWTRTPAR